MESYTEDLFSDTSDRDRFVRENLSFLIEDEEISEVEGSIIRYICRDCDDCIYTTPKTEQNLIEAWTILNHGCICATREKPSKYPIAYMHRKSSKESLVAPVPIKNQPEIVDLSFLTGQTSTPKKNCSRQRKLDFSTSIRDSSEILMRNGLTNDSLDCSTDVLSFRRPTTFLDSLLKPEEFLDSVEEASFGLPRESILKEVPLDSDYSWPSHSSGYIGYERERSKHRPRPVTKSLKNSTIYEDEETSCKVCLKESKLKSLTLADFLESTEETPKSSNEPPTDEGNKENLLCKFCYKNGELPKIYGSHMTKTAEGIVLCPILRKYVCDLCGESGDKAHTRKYCPLNTQERFVPRPVFRRLSNGVLTTHYNHK